MEVILKSLLQFRKMGLVLFGHGLTENETDRYIEQLHTNISDFKKIIAIFEELGFEFISMAELIDLARNNFKYHKNWLHLTFDDGYQNIYKVGYPYLREKQIPFSLFISTYHIESQERLYTYKIRCAILNTKQAVCLPGVSQMLPANATREARIEFCKRVVKLFKTMSKPGLISFMQRIETLLSPQEWQHYNNLYHQGEFLTISQLKELANDSLVHIGSHNHHHLILNQNVSTNDVLYEMQTSKDWLQQHLGSHVVTYCYPNGSKNDFTPTSKNICRRLGYEVAFTTLRKHISPKTDKYEIPRIPIGKNLDELKTRLFKLALPDSITDLARSLHSLTRVGYL